MTRSEAQARGADLLYEGHDHDLLNDLDKEVVMADISSWFNARV